MRMNLCGTRGSTPGPDVISSGMAVTPRAWRSRRMARRHRSSGDRDDTTARVLLPAPEGGAVAAEAALA